MSAAAVGPFRFPDQAIDAANRDPRLTDLARRVYALVVHRAAATGRRVLSDEAIAAALPAGRGRRPVHPGSVARVVTRQLAPLGYFASVRRGTARGTASEYAWPKAGAAEAPSDGCDAGRKAQRRRPPAPPESPAPAPA